MTSSTNQTRKITPEDVESAITGFVSALFADMFDRPDAMATADRWMKGEILFLVSRSGLAEVPNDDGATESPTEPEPDDRPTPGFYL